MDTERLEVVEGEAGERAIARAAQLLRAGRLVAFPTETVYGLGALATDLAAVQAIFAAKERPSSNPLIVHVPDAQAARQYVGRWPEQAEALARAFWPGPLTLVLERGPAIPPEVTAGLQAVGVRAPAHPVAKRLLEQVEGPVAAPSANRYTRISPTIAAHVAKGLDGRIDAILDGGATPVGIESTVLDLSSARPRLLRPGAISREEIEAVIGPVEAAGQGAAQGAQPSPGLARKHYAPSAQVAIFSGELPQLPPGASAGVIALRQRPADAKVERWLQLPPEPAAYARQLYGALHALEDAGVTHVLLESVPADPAWAGVHDRIVRAAG